MTTQGVSAFFSSIQNHGAGQAWRHGSYGSSNYDYGQLGIGHSPAENFIHDSSHMEIRDKSIYRGELMRSNITVRNIHPGTYGHSNYISKQLAFGQSCRHYYYE